MAARDLTEDQLRDAYSGVAPFASAAACAEFAACHPRPQDLPAGLDSLVHNPASFAYPPPGIGYTPGIAYPPPGIGYTPGIAYTPGIGYPPGLASPHVLPPGPL